jgi:vacuolar-type H+-ATPase subunit H
LQQARRANSLQQGLKVAEQKAAEIIADANATLQRTKNQYDQVQQYGTKRKEQADKEHAAVLQRIESATMQYRERMDQAKREETLIITRAENQAKSIIEEANNDAIDIISTATAEAKEKIKPLTQQVQQLRNAADALQRKIEGYDAEYIIPGIGLLDDLAVDFGHMEAGQNLKAVRTNVRKMVKTGHTVRCKLTSRPLWENSGLVVWRIGLFCTTFSLYYRCLFLCFFPPLWK